MDTLQSIQYHSQFRTSLNFGAYVLNVAIFFLLFVVWFPIITVKICAVNDCRREFDEACFGQNKGQLQCNLDTYKHPHCVDYSRSVPFGFISHCNCNVIIISKHLNVNCYRSIYCLPQLISFCCKSKYLVNYNWFWAHEILCAAHIYMYIEVVKCQRWFETCK